MRAAVCVRVSPRPQDQVKYSPEIQETKCREWCDANGHEVVTVIQDILVSGGAANRFDSIFASLDANPVDLFVVSDLSRWTRDEPEVYWTVKARLTARGVQLHSVDEPYLSDGDMPFQATIQTMLVEMNARERQRLRQKTSAGVRAARASGKVWGRHFGWSWDPETRRYVYDRERITELYMAWVRGDSSESIGRRFGMHGSHVKRAISSRDQRAVVGDTLWLQAQARLPGRGPRSDTRYGNVYRGLLRCPFCGSNIQRHANERQPFNYGCIAGKHNGVAHEWRMLNVSLYVTPAVIDALRRLVVPEEQIVALNSSADDRVQEPDRDYADEIERLTIAWSKGRISDDRYEKAVSSIEGERDRPVVPRIVPVPQQVEIAHFAEQVDLETQDVDEATALNALLREAVLIEVQSDRQTVVSIREPYRHWAKD